MADASRISWLASYPKSGNTWIRMFLNAFITKFPLNINSAYQHVQRDNDMCMLQMMCPTCVEKLSVGEFFIYRPALLLNKLKISPTIDVCFKTHNAKVVLNGFETIPTALSKNAIYIIRDPRDVCISLSHHLGMTIDQTIEFMNNPQQGLVDELHMTSLVLSWSKHVETWTLINNNVPTLVVRFEDILDDPLKVFDQILIYFELTRNDNLEERLHFALEQSSFENLRFQEDKVGFIEKGKNKHFFRSGKAGQWKEHLTSMQSDKIKDDHKSVMEKFDYA